MIIPTDKLVEMLNDFDCYSYLAIKKFAEFNDIDPVVSGDDWEVRYCVWADINIPPRTMRQNKKAIAQSLRTKVFERDAYRCKICDDWHGLAVDHIIPESKGGTLDFDNLQTLCKSCNSKKGNKLDD